MISEDLVRRIISIQTAEIRRIGVAVTLAIYMTGQQLHCCYDIEKIQTYSLEATPLLSTLHSLQELFQDLRRFRQGAQQPLR